MFVFQWRSVLWACCSLCDFRVRTQGLDPCCTAVTVPGHRTQLDHWWCSGGSRTQEGKPTIMQGPGCSWQGSPRGGQDWPWRSWNGGFRIADRSRSIYRWQLWFSLLSWHPSKITSLSKSVFSLLALLLSLSQKSSTSNPKMLLKPLQTLFCSLLPRELCAWVPCLAHHHLVMTLSVYEQLQSSRRNRPLQATLPRLGKRSWILVTWEEPGSDSAAGQAEDGGGRLPGQLLPRRSTRQQIWPCRYWVMSQARAGSCKSPRARVTAPQEPPPHSASLGGDNKAEVTVNRKPLLEMVALGEGADLMLYPIFSSGDILLPSCRFW